MTRLHPEPPPLDPRCDALYLDFDGTLVHLAKTPDAVRVEQALLALLADVSSALAGRLAIVSGRAIEALDGFGVGGHTVAGSHGAEWRLTGGVAESHVRPAVLDHAHSAFARFAETRMGTLCEAKPLGTALHFRLAPDYATEALALAQRLADEAGGELHIQHGHAMVELRTPGADKGTALNRLHGLAPFAGHRPVFVGDDLTDEPAFAAAAAAGGYGIFVGAPMRQTSARYGLAGPDAVLAWLAGHAASQPSRTDQENSP